MNQQIKLIWLLLLIIFNVKTVQTKAPRLVKTIIPASNNNILVILHF